VCGGIQLAGHSYQTATGGRLAGIGVLDLETESGAGRLIGDLVIDAEIDGEHHRIVGYENHGGRTHLGAGCRPLGRVVSGHGNNGVDRTEGAIRDHVVGTYLHGPLLPKNPWVADRLLTWALEHRYGPGIELEPLDDTLEASAHLTAVTRAGLRR
jgi:CobQ-like glutamine amidotransferase family enzyme